MKYSENLDDSPASHKERYEEILEDMYLEVFNRMESNPEFKTKEIVELLQLVEEMLQVVSEEEQ